MLGSTIASAFVQPVQEMAKALLAISHALNELGRQAHTANQLKWLAIRAQGAGGFPQSDSDILIQVGQKVGTSEQRG